MKRAITTITAFLFPSLAFAQTAANAGIFAPVEGDKMMNLFSSLFGQLGSFGMGSTSDPMIGIISIINSAALLIGGLLSAYILLAGTLGTAHDGEVLGKKFSAMWLPIRFSIGTSLILPIFKGYCLIQAIVASLIGSGIGLADAGASAFMSQSNLVQVASTNLISPDVRNLAYGIFASEVCLNMLRNEMKTPDERILNPDVALGISSSVGLTGTDYYVGNTSGAGEVSRDACGSVHVPFLRNEWDALNNPQNGLTDFGVAKASSQQTEILIKALDAVASKAVNSPNPDLTEINMEIMDAAGAYRKAVSGVAAEAFVNSSAYDSLQKSVQQDGFIFLGAYYMKMAKLINDVNSVVASVPEASGVDKFPVYSLRDKWNHEESVLNGLVASSSQGLVSYGIGNTEGGDSDGMWHSIKEVFANGFNPSIIAKKAFSFETSFYFDDGENPLLKASNIGSAAILFASSAWAALGVIAMTFGIDPGVGSYIAATMLMILPPLMLFGVLAFYVLPWTPFLIWIGGIVAFVVAAIEAMIAAPLWVVSMLAEGHDSLGQGMNGFKMVLSLLLKPVLMVAGFAASVAFLQVFGDLIGKVFADVYNLSQSNSGLFMYLVGVWGVPFLYVGLLFFIVKTAFSMIHTVPDQIVNWIGGMGTALSGKASESGGTGTAAAAGAMVGANAASSAANQIIQQQGGGSRGMKKEGMNPNAEMKEASAEVGNPSEGSPSSDEGISLKDQKARAGENLAQSYADTLGLSPGSHEAAEFASNAKEGGNLDSLANASLNQRFGSGSGKVVGTAGGGYVGEKAASAREMIQKAHSSLSESRSPDEAKEAVADVNSKALRRFKNEAASERNGGEYGVSDYFATEFNKVSESKLEGYKDADKPNGG